MQAVFWSRDITAQTHALHETAQPHQPAIQPANHRFHLTRGCPDLRQKCRHAITAAPATAKITFSCITYRASLKPPAQAQPEGKHSQKKCTARALGKQVSKPVFSFTDKLCYTWIWIWIWICGVVSKWSSSGLTRWRKMNLCCLPPSSNIMCTGVFLLTVFARDYSCICFT